MVCQLSQGYLASFVRSVVEVFCCISFFRNKFNSTVELYDVRVCVHAGSHKYCWSGSVSNKPSCVWRQIGGLGTILGCPVHMWVSNVPYCLIVKSHCRQISMWSMELSPVGCPSCVEPFRKQLGECACRGMTLPPAPVLTLHFEGLQVWRSSNVSW